MEYTSINFIVVVRLLYAAYGAWILNLSGFQDFDDHSNCIGSNIKNGGF